LECLLRGSYFAAPKELALLHCTHDREDANAEHDA
jgi:hypothetical protein